MEDEKFIVEGVADPGPPYTIEEIHSKPIRLFENAVHKGVQVIEFDTPKACSDFYRRVRALWHGKAARFECYLGRPAPDVIVAAKDPESMPGARLVDPSRVAGLMPPIKDE